MVPVVPHGHFFYKSVGALCTLVQKNMPSKVKKHYFPQRNMASEKDHQGFLLLKMIERVFQIMQYIICNLLFFTMYLPNFCDSCRSSTILF